MFVFQVQRKCCACVEDVAQSTLMAFPGREWHCRFGISRTVGAGSYGHGRGIYLPTFTSCTPMWGRGSDDQYPLPQVLAKMLVAQL